MMVKNIEEIFNYKGEREKDVESEMEGTSGIRCKRGRFLVGWIKKKFLNVNLNESKSTEEKTES